MGNIFGKSKREKEKEKELAKQAKLQGQVSSTDKALLDLKNSRDKLKRFQKRLNAESKTLEDQIKSLLKEKNRDKAMFLLKFKKLRENEVSKCYDQLLNLEAVINTLSFEKEQVKIFEAMKEGNKALESIHKVMSIEAVQDLMDDTEENIAYQKEITALLSGSMVEQTDEDELLKEIGWVEETTKTTSETTQDVSEKLPDVPDTPVLPIVPTSDPSQVKEKEKETENEKEEERGGPVLA